MCHENTGVTIVIIFGLYVYVELCYPKNNATGRPLLFSPFVQTIYILYIFLFRFFIRNIANFFCVLYAVAVNYLCFSTIFNVITWKRYFKNEFKDILGMFILKICTSFNETFEENRSILMIYYWMIQSVGVCILMFLVLEFFRNLRRGDIGFATLQNEYGPKCHFDKIPSIVYQNYISLKLDECAICLTKYKQDDTIKILPGCFHKFHGECIKEWFQNSQSCPFCRKDLTYLSSHQCESINEDEILEAIQGPKPTQNPPTLRPKPLHPF
ncbi:unnamed protein product [Moneuplotes crassus]|uniref:RING-type domain-containing protein n=1 Tax=Euplotes crassus TaxID=5936 RepID=A0AAD2D369_EUPCR|nr:unnamed protein product [Moneuplotes crassus]